MRIFVPTTLDSLELRWTVPAGVAFAVTNSLREAIPGEDEEGLEFEAFRCAAEEALWCHLDHPNATPLRVVVTVEVSDDAVVDGALCDANDETVPGRVMVTAALEGTALIAIHVDEPDAAGDIAAALELARALPDDVTVSELPDEFVAACERVNDHDLLWYDPTELSAIPRL